MVAIGGYSNDPASKAAKRISGLRSNTTHLKSLLHVKKLSEKGPVANKINPQEEHYTKDHGIWGWGVLVGATELCAWGGSYPTKLTKEK